MKNYKLETILVVLNNRLDLYERLYRDAIRGKVENEENKELYEYFSKKEYEFGKLIDEYISLINLFEGDEDER